LNRTTLSSHLQTLARFAFAATVFLIPFRYRVVLVSRPFETIYPDYLDFILFAADASMLATLLFWFISHAARRRRISFGPFFIAMPLAGLTASASISSIFSLDPWLSIYHSIRLVLLAGFYLYTVNEIASLVWVMVPLALQVFVQATTGIAQALSQHSRGLQALGEYDLDPAWSGVSVVFANGVRSLRAYGLSDHPNILGGCLVFGLLLIATWFVQSSSRWRGLAVGVFALGAVGLLLTFSRAAWLAMGLALIWIAVLFCRTNQRQALTDFAALGIATAILISPFIYQNANFLGVRLNLQNPSTGVTIGDRSVAERNALNQAANKIFAARPIVGVGIGAMPLAVRFYYPDFDFYYQPTHIALLDAAAETGILGALFYFALMLAPWIALWVYRARLIESPMFIGVSAVLLAITVVGLFDYYTWLLVPGRLWQYLAWGLWGKSINT
jgi:hypothetical protein